MAKVLCVEDDQDFFDLCSRRLLRAGHTVLHAVDDRSALELARGEGPDLIFMDIRLGQFSADGWEINRQLKADPATRRIPVVCLSASAEAPENQARSGTEGFAAHYIKTDLTKTILLDCVAECLARAAES